MIVRVIWAIFLVSILSSPVLSLSLIKSEVPSTVDLLTHKNEIVTYTIKGDNSTHKLELFAKSTEPTKLLINGKSQYSENTTLSPFQTKTVQLTLDGVSAGDTVVTFGARSKGTTNGTVGFDQVVQSTFDVEIDCTVECKTTTTTTRRTSSGGGGGGGGSIVTTTSAANSTVVTPPVVESTPKSETPVQIDSVTGVDSATNELVVPEPSAPREFVANVAESVSNSVQEGANKEQMRTLGLLLFFSVGTLGTTLSVLAVKRGMDK